MLRNVRPQRSRWTIPSGRDGFLRYLRTTCFKRSKSFLPVGSHGLRLFTHDCRAG
ncbi:unnamed protein product, partial [Ectocarpus sp. 12 AP-2014]